MNALESRDAPELTLPGLLVAPAWLRARLGRPGLRTIDLREGDAYARGHVPGAVHLELEALGTETDECENVLLPPDAFAELMAARGISSGDVVVAYDDQWGLAAARLAWALHRYGHTGVAVLDGGWDRWREEGGPIAGGPESADSQRVEPAPIEPGLFRVRPRSEVHADAEWIAASIARGDAVLLDTRTPAEFERGHLPGALVWDWFHAVPQDSWNVSRDPDELRAEWRALGFDVGDEVAVYCRSGMRAAHTWLVLRNAGFPRVRLYDGSWQEWSMRSGGSNGG